MKWFFSQRQDACRNFGIFLLVLVGFVSGQKAKAQVNRLNVQYLYPSGITVCGKADTLVIELRNISASALSSVYLNLKLPSGIYYNAGSLKSGNTSEFNLSDLNSPVFKLPDFTLAGYLKIRVHISASCNLQSYISKGNQAIPILDLSYSGGKESQALGALNVNVPNILINTISNQVKNAYLNDKFTREISIRNTGKGGASIAFFFRTKGNGLKIASSRIGDKYAADSIISKLDSNDFKKIGNKDAWLDGGEEVKITDTVTLVKCYNLVTIYALRFGCMSSLCNTSSKNAIVNLDPFTAGLTIIPSSKIDWCFDAGKPTKNQLIVVNKSNKPILGTMLNIYQSYNGGFYNAEMSAIDTTSIQLTKGKYGAKVKKTFSQVRYNFSGSYFSCLGTSPVGGFSLYLGSMKVGDTLYISWQTTACVPDVCNTTLTANRWIYSASYNDTCGANYYVNEAWGSAGGIQYFTSIPWIPADILNGTKEVLNFTVSSASFFPYNAKARFTLKLNLQSGLKHSLKADDFKFTDINGNEWKPYTIKANSSGDVLAYFYSPPISLIKAELDIVIGTDCAASGGSGLKSYTLSLLNNLDTSCQTTDFQIYCTSGQVKLHCNNTCSNGGMFFKSFKVKRKTLGKPDNNNDGLADASGNIDFSKIKLNRSMVYDTFSAFYSGMVVSSGSTNVFFNGRIKSSVTNGNLLKPLPAKLQIFRNQKLRYSCNQLPVTTYLSGKIRFCEIDLNINAARTAGCPNISNYFFVNGDSAVVILDYVIESNIGVYSDEAFFENPEFYLSTTPNPSPSQKLQCDTFSGRHILLGSYFTNWYTENYSALSCSPIAVQNSFYFSAGNCCNNYAGGNPFPYEFRNFNYLDKIKVALPKGYTFSSAAFYYYRSAGTSNYNSSSSTNLKPKFYGADTLVFDLDTFFNPTKGIFKRSDEGYQGTLVLYILPGCKSAISTYEALTYYSYFKWPDAGVTDVIQNYPDNIKFDHPSVLLTAINTLSSSKKDTFSWDIIMSNTVSGSSISNVWLSNTAVQKAKVFRVVDLATGKPMVLLNGIFQAGNLSSTSARTFRIYATSKNCLLDSFKMAVGWNCQSYPDSLNAYSCKNLLSYVNLILSPEPPLIVSTLLEDTARTDVCTGRKYQAIIANVDEDNIYHLKLRVTIPKGTTFMDTGMYYSFPYGSAFKKLSKPVLVSGTTYEWALSDSLSVLKDGLEKVSDTTKSRIKIQFFIETNCQITAGAVVSIMPDGKIGCGEPVKRIGFTGKPIKIKGVDNPYYSIISVAPDSVNLCKPNISIKAKIIYLGPTNTLADDSLFFSMPIGFIPDTSSLSTVRINGKGKVVNENGEMRWSWSIPKGLLPGDSSMLDFKLIINQNAPPCGSEVFQMQAVTKKKAYCVKTKDSCSINVATGTYYKAFKLDRAAPVLRLDKATSVNAGDSGELVNINFRVINNKKAIDSSMSTSFYLLVDKNKNGKMDKGETVIRKFTKSQGWNYNQSVSFSFNGFVKNTDICQLYLISDSLNCQCLKNSLPVLNIQTLNAGRDTTFCSNNAIAIGMDSVKKYKYEWLPSDYLSSSVSSRTFYKKPNYSASTASQTYILKTTKVGGCASLDTVVIKSNPFIILPKLKDTVAICEGGSKLIGDTAKGGKGPLSFTWSPSGGLSSASKMVVFANPTKSTKYFITIRDQNNCSLRDSSYVQVAKLPAVKIGSIGNCEKTGIKFFDESNYFGIGKGSTLWKINFNNVSQIDPTFIFDTIGYYFVRLVVSNKYGCSDSNYKYIRVNGNPVIFNTKANPCLGDSVKLTDISTAARMGIKSVKWRFNSDSLYGSFAKKVFKTAGYHYFTQIVSSDSGCVNSLFDSVLVLNKPVSGFSKIGHCEQDTLSFTNQSTYSGTDSLVSYVWKVNKITSYNASVKLKADTFGTFSASLMVTSKAGCVDSSKLSYNVHATPKANYTLNNVCPYDSLKPLNLSALAAGKYKAVSWHEGSTLLSGQFQPVFSPMQEGKHTIRLILVSDSLCTDTFQSTVTVFPGIRVKAGLLKGCENQTMEFADISNLGNAKLLSREWKIGSTLYSDSAFSNPVSVKGFYPFQLTLTSTDGCKFKLDSVYEVLENPKADFSFLSKCNDQNVDFTNLSNAGSSTTISSSTWQENFVAMGSTFNFSKKFSASGITKVTLLVQNKLGCFDSLSKEVLIAPKNYANFSIADACPFDTIRVDFTGFTGSNPISSYNLQWGDGSTSALLPAFHSYAVSGSYTAKLSINTLPGCSFDTSKTVQIYNRPKADFEFYPLYPDVKNSKVTFTDKSSGAVNWQYSFGDGQSSVKQSPIYTFRDSGAFWVKQTVKNQWGCTDSLSKRVYINFILLTHIPNAFSPGNDPYNPRFEPSGLGIKDFRIVIFNRWGEKLFDEGWGRKAWDGKYEQEWVQSGYYPYYIEIIDYGNFRHSYNGVVHVVR